MFGLFKQDTHTHTPNVPNEHRQKGISIKFGFCFLGGFCSNAKARLLLLASSTVQSKHATTRASSSSSRPWTHGVSVPETYSENLRTYPTEKIRQRVFSWIYLFFGLPPQKKKRKQKTTTTNVGCPFRCSLKTTKQSTTPASSLGFLSACLRLRPSRFHLQGLVAQLLVLPALLELPLFLWLLNVISGP